MKRSAMEGLRRARSARSGPLTVSWLPDASAKPPALVFAIGKRVGNAVVRNRLRRRLREAARRLGDLPPGLYLIRVNPATATALSFQDMTTYLSRAVRSLTQKVATEKQVASDLDRPTQEGP
ncbi:MAG TPA: ribonuclease P protein component [Acidimicrobiales bacterium]|nr:ribonuclease P protein component [Acidimicrobiales bacterium]